jgi:hypothetical protein
MMNSTLLLILMMVLYGLGCYPVGEGWKVVKIMHFGIHYSKELPSH